MSRSQILISTERPRPLLDQGEYSAKCTDATIAWAKRYKKWIVRLVMEPTDYNGRVYNGDLCKFLQLGTDPKKPHAGQNSDFRKLWVQVNGAQPTGDLNLDIFVGHAYKIAVTTVKADRH